MEFNILFKILQRWPHDVLTLHEVEDQDAAEDGSGGDLDPPLEEEWEEQHSDQALPGQGRPGALWLGFAEGRA